MRSPMDVGPAKRAAIQTAERLAKELNRPIHWTLPPDGAKDVRRWVSEHDRDLTGADVLLKNLMGTAQLAGGTEQPKSTARIIFVSAVEPRPVEWVWPGRVPAGTITVLDGDPGLGKSFVTLDSTARITRGRAMPPDSGDGASTPANVLLMNAEDDLARTIRPRLEALGVDLDRVLVLEEIAAADAHRPPMLPDDLPVIAALVRQHSVKLVVIDPLAAFLNGDVDTHKDSDIRRVMYGIRQIAEATGEAFLIVHHLNKLVNVGDPIYRGGGSIGIIGAARSALLVAKHPDDPYKRVLARSKGNLCAEPESLVYAIEPQGETATVAWLGTEELTAADLLANRSGRNRTGRTGKE